MCLRAQLLAFKDKCAAICCLQVALVVSENVQREARSQFNCPELEGAQLEDEGGSGTALSHW